MTRRRSCWAEVARRREAAEEALAAQSRERERLQGRVFAARSAAERIAMRLERVSEQVRAAAERRDRRLRQLELLEAEAQRAATAEAEPLPEEALPRPPQQADPDAEARDAWEELPRPTGSARSSAR